MTSPRSVDWWLAALLFAAAAGVGSAYVYVFDNTGVRMPPDLRSLSKRTMWFGQREFGAAVALACGRGFVDTGYSLTPGLSAFLSLQEDRFSCTELPAALPPRAPNLTQRLYRYLMWAAAGVWAVRGVSWSGLWPLYGVLYGATVAACYALFRFGMGRALACASALAIAVSALHLSNLPGLRDYAKAPFILGLILIAAHLARRIDRTRSLLVLAALFGAMLGVGFGFRNDILIMAPVLLVALLVWKVPRDARAIGRRLAALGVAAATFTLAAWPILSAYARGSNSGHVALLGLTSEFEPALGVAGSVYEWGHLFSDEFADTLINSYTYRVHGHPVAYLSADYDRAMADYLAQIARHWPADIVTRAYGAVLTIVNVPFSPGLHVDAVPYGIHSPALVRLFNLQTDVISLVDGAGVAIVALALLVVGRASVWLAVLLLAALLYLAGYPAIQLQPRHFFHLEFVGWWALGFLVQRASAAAAAIVRARRRGDLQLPVSWVAVRRMATFAGLALAMVALPLAGLRVYQQRHIRAFLRGYVDAPREPLAVESVEAGARTLLQTSTLWTDRDAGRHVNTQYIVAVFSPAACPAARLPVTFRYAVKVQPDYSLDTIVAFQHDAPAIEIFFPAYHVNGRSRFDGVEVPRGFERCVQEISRVRDLTPLPMLLHLTLTAGWEQAPLYQRLAWELPARPLSPPVFALPKSLPVTHATLHQNVEPPALEWRTAIVQGDFPRAWRIIGTPPRADWPVLQVSARARTPADRFVVEGEVERGGITVGLVHGETWTDDGTLTIAAAGRFRAVLAPSTPGVYGVLFVNALGDSWLLRHAPLALVQFAGRFRALNDVRIAKAGWTPE